MFAKRSDWEVRDRWWTAFMLGLVLGVLGSFIMYAMCKGS